MVKFHKFSLIATAFAISASLTSAARAEGTADKNGWPCVNEICLNDGLSELKKISWTIAPIAADSKYVPVISLDRALDEDFASTIKGNAKELHQLRKQSTLGAIDIRGINILERIIASCKFSTFTARYKSKTGQDTKVEITSIPINDSGDFAFRVTNIERVLPNTLNTSQVKEIEQSLIQRYGDFYESEPFHAEQAMKKGVVKFYASPSKNSFSIALDWTTIGRKSIYNNLLLREEWLMNNPLCHATKPSID
jgi:hypothetical protein